MEREASIMGQETMIYSLYHYANIENTCIFLQKLAFRRARASGSVEATVPCRMSFVSSQCQQPFFHQFPMVRSPLSLTQARALACTLPKGKQTVTRRTETTTQ
jgi:hypothetical protein